MSAVKLVMDGNSNTHLNQVNFKQSTLPFNQTLSH